MKRSKHNLSHTKLLSCNMGLLIPITCFEVLPGDSIQMSTAALIRAAPLLAPIMHPVDVRIHHWFVPNRLIWDAWEDFITGGPDGTFTATYPYKDNGGGDPPQGGLADYLGIPPGAYPVSRNVSVLPFRAYNLIWNEWYRDQDLQTERVVSKASGLDTTTTTGLANIAWEKDYFTAARPWEQKGPAVTLPLGTTAPVAFREIGATPGLRTLDRADGNLQAGLRVEQTGTGGGQITAEADLTGASAITVSALREALAIQRFEEARARYGSRYSEYLRFLGVRSSDARLQRPEFLGGGRQRIQFSEVLQTAPTANTNVGEMKGHGIAAMRSNRWRRFFEEHGFVMSLLSVRPKTIYMSGLNRMYMRGTKEDYWQREYEHVGQQWVDPRELWAQAAPGAAAFGYTDRYSDYRQIPSTVAGEFRTTLDYWHMARSFASAPALNSSFVSCVPTERNFADTSSDVLYVQARHSVQARRLVTGNSSSFIY